MISSGACQLANRVTTHAVTIGQMIEPICPVVFMVALRIAVCAPPMSMQAAQVELSVNIDAATDTAIRIAAVVGLSDLTDASIATPATAYPAIETEHRPIR